MSSRKQPPETGDQEPEIMYVPGAENHYKYDHNVIVLDEQLKDYPKAHEYIKNHELEHVRHGKPENRGFVELIQLEWQTDLDHYFADNEVIAEVREYFEDKREREQEHLPPKTFVKFGVVSLLRGAWDLALRPCSWVYWRVNG